MPSHRSLGLIANPFLEFEEGVDDAEARLALDQRATVSRVVVALDAASAQSRPAPVWLDRGGPEVTALARSIVRRAPEAGVFAAAVPFVGSGRIRAAVLELATAVAGPVFDDVLTDIIRWVGEQDPDEALPSWESLGELGWQSVLDGFEDSPDATVTDLFHTPRFAPPAEEGAEPERLIEPAARYVLDYLGTHRSRTLARAIAERCFVDEARFADAMAETKAPRRALGALVWAIELGGRVPALVHHGFDEWFLAPDEDRFKSALAYAELRLHAGPRCLHVLLAGSGTAPELGDLFAGGAHVTPVVTGDARTETERADIWMESARIDGRVVPGIGEGALSDVWTGNGGSLAVRSTRSARAVDSAAARVSASVEAQDVSGATQE